MKDTRTRLLSVLTHCYTFCKVDVTVDEVVLFDLRIA